MFSDQWEMVALHHSAVPAMDEDGRYLTKDGEPWNQAMGVDRLQWVANEGVRVSAVSCIASSKNPSRVSPQT